MNKWLARLIAALVFSAFYLLFLSYGANKLRTQMNDALTATGSLPW